MDSKLKKIRAILIVSIIVLLSVSSLEQAYAAYENKNSLISKFKTLCNEHRNYASYASLGETTLGNDIWIFRIGNPSGKVVMWDAQLHGGEDLGSEIELLMAEWLLESGERTAKSILSRNYVLFIPAVNFDSYVRTNAHHVNLNRNFVYRWGETGSRDPSSSEYMGRSAASEKETQVMRNAFRVYRPEFYVNTHMWGGPRLFSWRGNNPTLVSQVKAKIAQISDQHDVEPYPTCSISGAGFAIADAGYYYKACAWLLEVNGLSSRTYNAPPYSAVLSIYYPKCLPILIAMCQLA